MADEEQERVEDYLELERYIEALQAGQVAHPPLQLSPEQARIYQMAALFRSAAPENAEPSLAFAEQLKAQLLDARAGTTAPSTQDAFIKQQNAEAGEKTVSPVEEIPTTKNKGQTKPARFFSRRGLLTGGAIAAASLVVGIGTERVLEQTRVKPDATDAPTPPNSHLEITNTIPTTWHFVTMLADLGQNALRFTSNAIIGYVLRTEEGVVALSAACTHMGCIVQWHDSDRRFHCPCHSALFAENGTFVNTHYRYTLPPLPLLNIKVEDGKVYVEVPA